MGEVMRGNCSLKEKWYISHITAMLADKRTAAHFTHTKFKNNGLNWEVLAQSINYTDGRDET